VFISSVGEVEISGVVKCLRCGAPGVALNAPKPDEAPSGMQGNRDEVMKNISSYINLYKS